MPPTLPPAYAPEFIVAGDCFEIACARAGTAEPGTLLWRGDAQSLSCAVVLAPERPLAATRIVARVALLALADALAVLAPPSRPIGVAADRLMVDGAEAARVRFAADADEAAPAWAVVGVDLALRGDPSDEPGRHPERTTLWDEGFGEIDPGDALAGFARHFLAWLDRWDAEGDEAVRHYWQHREMAA